MVALIKGSHFWDCNGLGCDSSTLSPWDPKLFVAPDGYQPQDPLTRGGPKYGERLWMVGAASDKLATMLGDDSGCCGTDSSTTKGGCGKCMLVQNMNAVNFDWKVVVMKKSRERDDLRTASPLRAARLRTARLRTAPCLSPAARATRGTPQMARPRWHAPDLSHIFPPNRTCADPHLRRSAPVPPLCRPGCSPWLQECSGVHMCAQPVQVRAAPIWRRGWLRRGRGA